MITPDYLAGYSPAQLRIILEERPVKQVIAAAGSGKTRTVIGLVEHRLRSGLEERILLLSFSRRAVGELRERLPRELRDGVEISTFHSFCFRWLSRLDPARANGLQILEDSEKERVLRDALRECDMDEETGGIPYDVLLGDPERFRRLFPNIAEVVYARLAAYKQEHGRLEYDDLVEEMLVALEANAPYLRELRRRYGLIIVDEFQDTDPRQLEFLRLMQPPRMLVVGDDWQAIYSFRGATVRPFLDFQKLFARVKVYRLAENYRSLSTVVRAGDAVIAASRHQLSKRVRAVRGRGPQLPVAAFALRCGDEPRLRSEILADDDFHGDCYRILVRTNYRRQIFLNAGFPEERVMTVHKAKGLEFPVVFLDVMAGWNSERARSSRFHFDQRPQAVSDEEIRVLYVGASRAMNLLIILHEPPESGKRADDDETPEEYYWNRLLSPKAKECDAVKLRKLILKEKKYREKS